MFSKARLSLAFPVSALALAMVLSACDQGSFISVIKGSGNVVTENRQVSGFDSVVLAGSGNVTVQMGDAESLTVETDDNIMPKVKTEVKGGTLSLGFQPNTSVNATRLNFRVTAKSLKGLTLSGSGNITADGLNGGSHKAVISGSGSVLLHGTLDSQDVSITGSGTFASDSVPCKEATVQISGSGSATVRASDSLKASITGSGNVNYIGNPAVEKTVSGSGSVVKMQDQ